MFAMLWRRRLACFCLVVGAQGAMMRRVIQREMQSHLVGEAVDGLRSEALLQVLWFCFLVTDLRQVGWCSLDIIFQDCRSCVLRGKTMSSFACIDIYDANSCLFGLFSLPC